MSLTMAMYKRETVDISTFFCTDSGRADNSALPAALIEDFTCREVCGCWA